MIVWAHLCRVVEIAAPELAIDHDTAADAGAQREQHEAAHVLPRARGELAEGSRVGVILEHRRDAGRGGHAVAQGNHGPAEQVRGFEDNALFVGHRTGGADADACHLRARQTGAANQISGKIRHAADDVIDAAVALGRDGVFDEQLARAIAYAALDVRTAKIDADRVLRRHASVLCQVPVRTDHKAGELQVASGVEPPGPPRWPPRRKDAKNGVRAGLASARCTREHPCATALEQ